MTTSPSTPSSKTRPLDNRSAASGEIAVVFIHTRLSYFLSQAMAQARPHNPGRRIVLIGDAANARLCRMLDVEFIPMETLSSPAGETFKKTYRHLSNNPFGYERFCLERWFLLLAWMDTQGPGCRALHLDSDVMLYADADRLANEFAVAPMTFVDHCGHVSLVRDQKVLAALCDFVLETYASETAFKAFCDHVMRPGKWPWISDMPFFVRFHELHPELLHSMLLPGPSNLAVDLRINSGVGGYAMRDDVKDLSFPPGAGALPQCYNTTLGRSVDFAALHFQGPMKDKMWAMRSREWPLSLTARIFGYRLFCSAYYRIVRPKAALAPPPQPKSLAPSSSRRRRLMSTPAP